MTSQLRMFNILILIVLSVLISSCRSQKEIKYFQAVEDSANAVQAKYNLFSYEPVIRSNDILKIYVSSINREASSFFNPVVDADSKTDNAQAYGYLVDAKGIIEVPVVGSLKVEGMTVPQIRDTLKSLLSKYLDKPTVRVIFDNFRVTVLGEVTRPGVYTVQNERLTIPEALGLAGDLTIFGKRTNVMIIREENGKKEFATIDLTKRDLLESPYYFLHPNDILYIEPGSGKTALSDNFYRIMPIVISTITLITVIMLRIDQSN